MTLNRINVLSDETIIKIAAGEVIENPASIVKELVENSVDAGSDKIIIEIENNGSSLIKISDNGMGMSKEDLKIAFKRHTTSKILKIDDLERTYTLGFRGEALSSVAAVSKVEVITKVVGELAGIHAIIDDSGNIVSQNEIVSNEGTTISCRDLFHSMPVRKNYLENKNFEISKTNDIINRLALSNPDVSMDYIKDSQLIIKTNKNRDLLSNIYSVLGNNIGNNLLEVTYSDEYISIHGYVSNNLLFKGNRNSQYLFINNRAVFDVNIGKSIEKAYSSVIPINRFPVFILYIDIDPKYLDINIHPKKSLIKVLDFIALESKIEKLVKESLSKHLKIPNLMDRQPVEKSNIFSENAMENLLNDRFISSTTANDIDIFPKEDNKNEQKSEVLVELRDYSSDYHVQTEKINESSLDVERSEEKPSENMLFPNGYRYIGNLFLQYLLIEDNIDKTLYVLDQHAIHERINYEKLVESYKKGNIATQNLISGYIVELTKNEFDSIIAIKEQLLSLGIEVEDFGDNSVIIRSIPIYLDSTSPESILLNILESDVKIDNLHDFDPYKVMRIACRSSVKSGKHLSSLEVQRLIEELQNCDMPLSCPHGRPTMIKITNNWLEKEFFRVQT